MHTATLFRSTSHPPCPQEQEILEIALPADRTGLALTDRLSLRLGLWLMLRSQRPRRAPRQPLTHEQVMLLLEARRATEHEAMTALTYGLQRHML